MHFSKKGDNKHLNPLVMVLKMKKIKHELIDVFPLVLHCTMAIWGSCNRKLGLGIFIFKRNHDHPEG